MSSAVVGLEPLRVWSGLLIARLAAPLIAARNRRLEHAMQVTTRRSRSQPKTRQRLFRAGDMAGAARVFGRCAQMGDAACQLQLGWHYEEGKGVPRNLAEAVKRYPAAADAAALTRSSTTPYRESRLAHVSQSLYLDLMKRVLTNLIYEDPNVAPWQPPGFSRELRLEGKDWPRDAHTMVGWKRLDHLQSCIEDVLADGVPGDLAEAGAWRGGAAIFMRAVLRAHAVTDRRVWVADSFAGLPPPDPERFPADAGDRHHEYDVLAVPLDVVRGNFARYDLLDDQVRFIAGWFRDTLWNAPIERLAVLRLDGDMYESTALALTHLYSKLAPGGYAIIDDYQVVPGCRRAVDDFRSQHGIVEAIRPIDWAGVYWRRER